MTDCIFCKIVAGDIPSARVYEDEDFVVFLDIRPVNPGHLLIVPRAHHQFLHEVPDKVLQRELVLVGRLVRALIEAIGMKDYNILNNNGSDSGQEVPHHHVHIIPRTSEDGFRLNIPHSSYKEGYAEVIAGQIRSKMGT